MDRIRKWEYTSKVRALISNNQFFPERIWLTQRSCIGCGLNSWWDTRQKLDCTSPVWVDDFRRSLQKKWVWFSLWSLLILTEKDFFFLFFSPPQPADCSLFVLKRGYLPSNCKGLFILWAINCTVSRKEVRFLDSRSQFRFIHQVVLYSYTASNKMVLPSLFIKVPHLLIAPPKKEKKCSPLYTTFETMRSPKVLCSSHEAGHCTAGTVQHQVLRLGLYLRPIKHVKGRVIAVRRPSVQGYYSAACNYFLYFLIWWQTWDMMDEGQAGSCPSVATCPPICCGGLRNTTCGALSRQNILHLRGVIEPLNKMSVINRSRQS